MNSKPPATAPVSVYADAATAAKALGISATTLWRLASTGRLEGIRTRIGRAWRFHLAKLIRAAEAGELDLTSG